MSPRYRGSQVLNMSHQLSGDTTQFLNYDLKVIYNLSLKQSTSKQRQIRIHGFQNHVIMPRLTHWANTLSRSKSSHFARFPII